jgi:hypothetical protein
MTDGSTSALRHRHHTAVLAALFFTSVFRVPAQGQCQTWADEPQFKFGAVNGNHIDACLVFDDGTGVKLWVAGNFWTSNFAVNVARWDGASWIWTPGLNDTVDALAIYDEGVGQGPLLYAGGVFTLPAGRSLALWNGNSWESVGGGVKPYVPGGGTAVNALAEFDSGNGPDLYVGGQFAGAGTTTVASKGIVRWNGATNTWHPLGSGLTPGTFVNPYVENLLVYDDGNGRALFVAGNFGSAGGQPIPWLAKWDGSNWSSVGSGINGLVTGMCAWDDGSGTKLYVSGLMTLAGGVPVSKLAIWDGSSWSPFPAPPAAALETMVPFDDGRGPALFTGGFVQTSTAGGRWDGTSWSSLGSGIGSLARAAVVHDDGSGHGPDLYFGGLFYTVGGGTQSVHIARWIRCPGPIDSFCPGDHTLAACPCGNPGVSGHGCENSAATGGALLTPFGSTSPDTLRFASSGELESSLTIFLQGSAPTASAVAFGSGLRCSGGALLRLFVTHASGGIANAPGTDGPTLGERSAALGDPLGPGDVRLYQAYYRDPFAACGSTFNVTNGVRVVW